jgi:hypothetical protein
MTGFFRRLRNRYPETHPVYSEAVAPRFTAWYVRDANRMLTPVLPFVLPGFAVEHVHTADATLVEILHLMKPTADPQRARPPRLDAFDEASHPICRDRPGGLEAPLHQVP